MLNRKVVLLLQTLNSWIWAFFGYGHVEHIRKFFFTFSYNQRGKMLLKSTFLLKIKSKLKSRHCILLFVICSFAKSICERLFLCNRTWERQLSFSCWWSGSQHDLFLCTMVRCMQEICSSVRRGSKGENLINSKKLTIVERTWQIQLFKV